MSLPSSLQFVGRFSPSVIVIGMSLLRRRPSTATRWCVLTNAITPRAQTHTHTHNRPPHGASSNPTPYGNENAVEEYASLSPTRTTIRSMMYLGVNVNEDKLIESARHLRHELSVRLARRINDMNQLPFIAGCNPHIQTVYRCYVDAFNHFRTFPDIQTLEDEKGFVDVLRQCLGMHRDIIPTLKDAAWDIAEHMPRGELNAFLSKMITTRISRRVLAEHHLALHSAFYSGSGSRSVGRIGIVDEYCNPSTLVRAAAHYVQQQCDRAYGAHPEVRVEGHLDATFSYLPSHIEYMAAELLKNSARAVMERHALASVHPPPIVVTVCMGGTEITMRISDQGGAIDPDAMEYLWSYVPMPARLEQAQALKGTDATSMSRSRERVARQLNLVPGEVHDARTLPSIGFGMPMTRAYAAFLGGSLQVQNLSGYGVDAYVRLKHISDTEESFEI